MNNFYPDSLLKKHRGWIERVWLRLQPGVGILEMAALPSLIDLPSLNETWQLQYEWKETPYLRIKMNEAERLLLITGPTQDPLKIKQAIRKWLHKRAQDYLFPWLEGLSRETGLSYAQVRIRNTRTRWGSCSSRKNISLSCQLLFLNPLLVEHVLLHELCHTVHFNHARVFWDLLKTLSPDSDNLRKELKKAANNRPIWLKR